MASKRPAGLIRLLVASIAAVVVFGCGGSGSNDDGESSFAVAVDDSDIATDETPDPDAATGTADEIATADENATAETPGADEDPTPESIPDLVERVRDGVVFIEVKECERAGAGTGFVVGDRQIATAAHVVSTAESILITVGDYRSEANIVELDEDLDLALLEVPKRIDGWHFSFADDVRVGEDALVMGYPAALDFTVTTGSVTAVDAEDPFLAIPVIRFDAAANPGNSGGPVVNDRGEVIGVVTGSRTDLENTNYAIDGQATKTAIESWSGFTAEPPAVECDPPTEPADGYVKSIPDHPDAALVKSVFDVYLSGINSGYPEYSWPMLSEDFRARLGTQQDFIDGNATSFIYGFEISSIDDTDDGLAVQATFVSTQDPSYGPNGWPCAIWVLEYSLIPEGASFRIDGADNREGSPAQCEDE